MSAPYRAIIHSGSTPLFFDFAIFSMGPTSTGNPSACRCAPAMPPLPSCSTSTSAGAKYRIEPFCERKNVGATTIPCVSRLVNGSRALASPASFISFW